jgi:uncharacterized protein
MDFESALYVADERYDYGEARFQALGLIDGQLHMLVFIMRGSVMRAISLRKAIAREVRHYGDKAQTTGRI